MRQVGKVVDLSCGYLASVGAFVTMAAGYGIDLDELPALVLGNATPEQRKKAERAWRRALLTGEDYGLVPDTFQACHVLVQVYRAANSNIFENGHEIGRACIDAVLAPNAVRDISRCRIWSTGEFLIIQLPSGRRLLYAKPEVRYEVIKDPETGKEQRREYVSYLTARGKGWMRERAWAGLFLENIDQAIANDILRAGLAIAHRDTMAVPEIANYLRLIEGAETAICLHVHDEIGLDVPKGSYSKERLIECMTTKLLAETPWTHGLPLAASGYVGERFKK
jgi:DNA polymerase